LFEAYDALTNRYYVSSCHLHSMQRCCLRHQIRWNFVLWWCRMTRAFEVPQ